MVVTRTKYIHFPPTGKCLVYASREAQKNEFKIALRCLPSLHFGVLRVSPFVYIISEHLHTKNGALHQIVIVEVEDYMAQRNNQRPETQISVVVAAKLFSNQMKEKP